jgi:hypothetical protein
MVSLFVILTIYGNFFRQNCHIIFWVADLTIPSVGECPLDPGGYFIARGNEKVAENIATFFLRYLTIFIFFCGYYYLRIDH